MSADLLPGGASHRDPSHAFITGQTMMGKSTLGRKMMLPYLSQKIPVAVYSPVEPANRWDERAFVFADFYDFLVFVRKHMKGGGLLVIDEADTVLSQGDRANWWIATRSRHFGFRALILTQRPALVAPTVRGQCGECYAFNVADEDAKLLARDYSSPGLKEAPKLLQGQYIMAYLKDGRKVTEVYRVF